MSGARFHIAVKARCLGRVGVGVELRDQGPWKLVSDATPKRDVWLNQ